MTAMFRNDGKGALSGHDSSTLDVVGVTSYPMFAQKQSSGVTEKYFEPLTHQLTDGTPVSNPHLNST